MEIVYQCLTKGAADFLVKPVRKNELKNLWQHVWRKRYRVSHVSYSCIFQHLTFCALLYSLGLQNHKVVFATVLTVCSICHRQFSHVHSAVKLLQCVVSSYV
jgi:FixJ family two-component response regulator